MKSSDASTGNEIAVIGLDGCFPQADSPDGLWTNLVEQRNGITAFDKQELIKLGLNAALVEHEGYIPAKGILSNAEGFDAEFFEYTENDAGRMHPQTRKMHECVWRALENAGYNPLQYKGAIGLFAGASSDYTWKQHTASSMGQDTAGIFAGELLRDKDFMTTHIGYKLNFRGPCLNIQTGCSTSLVAVHMAGRALLQGDCDIALAGGVSISVPVKHGYLHQEGMIFSSDGCCRAFDKDADGTVEGSGYAAVVLKRLTDAVRDRDHIHAVIKGTAVNNDGARKVGYTAPSIEGVREAIDAAHNMAGVGPEDIRYIEAHGTGTALGDLLEVSALKAAYKETADKSIILGSIKASIGHLDAAAGIAGLIKAVFILNKRQVPATLHFRAPHPGLKLDRSPFHINNETVRLEEQGRLCVAVNSMGIGGNNAYAILENWEEEHLPEAPHQYNICILSAGTENGLRQVSQAYLDLAGGNPEPDWDSLAYTVKTGRQMQRYQTAFVFQGREEFILKLSDISHHYLCSKPAKHTKVRLMNMEGHPLLAELYNYNRLFRRIADHASNMEEADAVSLPEPGVLLTSLSDYLQYIGVDIPAPGGTVADSQPIAADQEAPQLFLDGAELKGVRDLYEQLVRLWREGLAISWERFHEADSLSRIPLPVYPFQTTRFPIPEHNRLMSNVTAGTKLTKEGRIADWFYAQSWHKQGLFKQASNKWAAGGKRNWLLFHDGGILGEECRRALEQENQSFRLVFAGDAYARRASSWSIAPQKSDYQSLLDDLQEEGFVPDKVIHLWTAAGHPEVRLLTVEAFRHAQEISIYSLLHLVTGLTNRFPDKSFDLGIVTQHAEEVVGDDLYYPEYSTLSSFCKTMIQEYTNVHYQLVDITEQHIAQAQDHSLAASLLTEFAGQHKDEAVAYRGVYRWGNDYKKIHVEPPPEPHQAGQEKGGLYVLFGGVGNVGLAIAESLLKEGIARKVILTGKSFIPEQSRWHYWLDKSKNEKLRGRLQKLVMLQEAGYNLSVFTVDITQADEVERLVQHIEGTDGAIDGVIHSAGLVGEETFCYMEELDEVFCDKLFGPKVYGTIVLEQVFRKRPLREIILLSSLASALGGMGQAAYSAANQFMNSFALHCNKHLSSRWRSIGLETWITDHHKARLGSSVRELKMTYSEGQEAFLTVFNSPAYPTVIQSVTDLPHRVNGWKALQEEERKEEQVQEWQGNEALLTETLLRLWSDFLGRSVGMDDHFFEQGGDSLKAIQLVSRMNHQLGIRLRLIDFFQNANVRELSAIIKKRHKPGKPELLPRRAAERPHYPMTYIQQSMVQADNKIYADRFNLGTLLTIVGPLRVDQFRLAIQKLINRHEILRTHFEQLEGEWVQIVHDQLHIEVPYYQSGHELERRKAEFVKPFELSTAPLLRIEIHRTGEEEHAVLLDMHHIVYDETGMNVFFRDLWKLYNGEDLSPLELHYKDFAVWQQHSLQTGALERERSYWLGKLGDYTPYALGGDLDLPEKCFSIYEHDVQVWRLAPLCAHYQITRLSFLISVLALALSQLDSVERIGLGLRVTNRLTGEFQDVLGCFLEKVVLILHTGNARHAGDYAVEVQALLLEAIENGIYPIGKLKEEQAISNEELTPILLNYMNVERTEDGLHGLGLTVKSSSIRSGIHSKYKMNLRIYDDGQRIVLNMKYSSSTYSKERIKQLFTRFDSLMEMALLQVQDNLPVVTGEVI
jgi:acyl transferase domain-containing protein/acyl carrier protein